MYIRPVVVEDVAWLPRMAERLFSRWEQGYGHAVAAWMGHDSTIGWVAAVAAGPIGFVLVGTLGVVGADRPHLLEILAVGVHPEARRRGVGRALVAQVLRHGRARRAREVRLSVAADNLPGQAMFLQAGFRVDRDDDGTFGKGRRAIRMSWRP